MAIASGGVVFGAEGTDLKLEEIQAQDFGQVRIGIIFWKFWKMLTDLLLFL